MKTIATLAILLILFVGIAGAVTVTTATWNAGHQAGDKFPGTVQASDLYATDDLLVGDDAQVLGDFSCSGIGTFTGGTITSNVYSDNLRLAANKSFYSTTGSGGIDWSNGTGIFKSPTGVNTIGGHLIVPAAKVAYLNNTIIPSGKTAYLNATRVTSLVASGTSYQNATKVTSLVASGTSYQNSTIISTGDTLAVTDADGATVGGVIIPQEMVLTIPIGASEVDQTAFIADDAWQITKIEEAHSVAQNTAYPNTGNLSINKCTGTQAPNAGAHLHNTTMWLNSTINTVVTPTLNAATGAVNLADGNRICLDFNGTMTTFAGGSVTIHMKRI